MLFTSCVQAFGLLPLIKISLGAQTPSGTTLGAISILAEDTLVTSDSLKTSAAVLLNSPSTFAAASKSCSAINEGLWSPTKQSFTAGLNNSLSYEVYSGRFTSDQLFWIQLQGTTAGGAVDAKQCQAITVSGTIEDVNCGKSLPALCTQSAPASNITFANTTATFRVAQTVGSQTLIGYRDFLTFRFMGVRFAAEPERFTYSTPYDGVGTSLAVTPAPECLQGSGQGSTDCLFANIFTTFLPAKAKPLKKNLKPVFVYIYGGGFVSGSASNPTNDGGNLAARGDVVMVDLAYRLSTLGFLTLKDGVHNGNYWISDVISGLQWIQANIENFGGDPARVTIFGESAGAETVQALLASSKAAGLFRGALMQSNYYQPYVPIATAYNQTTLSILDQTGCANNTNQLACLRAYNATSLITLQTVANYPVIDGTYLTSSYINLNKTGSPANSVPVLLGVNRDEAGVFAPFFPTTNLTLGIIELGDSIGVNSTAILESGDFPLGTGPGSNATLHVFNTTTHIDTISGFTCSNQFTAYAGVKTGALPNVWFYQFNRTYQDPGYNTNGVCGAPVTASHPNGDPSLEYFKCHAGDLANTFGNVARVGFPERDGLDAPFGQLITDYWTTFARNLNPNPDPAYLMARGYWNTLNQIKVAGQWTQVDAKNPSQMILQWNGAMTPFVDEDQCAVLGQSLDLLL